MKKFPIALVLLVFVFKFANAEYKIYGLVKETLSKMDIKAVSVGDPKDSGYSIINGYPDIRLGLKGFNDTNYNFKFLYKFEIDLDNAEKNAGAFADRNSFVGILNDSGVYVFGRLNEAPKAAIDFLDNWTSENINPFEAAAGYLPGIPVVGQYSGSSSLLASADNSFVAVSNRLDNNMKYSINLSNGLSDGESSLVGQIGARIDYLDGPIHIGFGVDSKNNTLSSKNGGNDAKDLHVLGIQYKVESFLLGASVVNAKEGDDKKMSGSNIDILHNYSDDVIVHFGFANFTIVDDKTNSDTKHTVNGFEIVYLLNQDTKTYWGLGSNEKVVDDITHYKSSVMSFGLLHKF